MEMARITGIVEEIDLPRYQTIFSPGMPSDSIYFIGKGRVRLTKLSPDGRMVILALLGPGDLIGEAAWELTEHDSYGETLVETQLYQISKVAFENLVRQNPEFGLRLIQIIGFRLKQAQSRIEDLVFRQVPSRIARLLVNLAEHHGKVTPQGIRVEFPLTHQEIADMVGSSRVTVTQVLNKFRSMHLIGIESKRVTIQDIEALEALVKEPERSNGKGNGRGKRLRTEDEVAHRGV
jgi:CRP/FNR family transcriptional regulator